jgi:hypothetical protein
LKDTLKTLYTYTYIHTYLCIYTNDQRLCIIARMRLRRENRITWWKSIPDGFTWDRTRSSETPTTKWLSHGTALCDINIRFCRILYVYLKYYCQMTTYRRAHYDEQTFHPPSLWCTLPARLKLTLGASIHRRNQYSKVSKM